MPLKFDIIVDDKGTPAIKQLGKEINNVGKETEKASRISKAFDSSMNKGLNKMIKNAIGFGGAMKAISFFQGSINAYQEKLISLGDKANEQQKQNLTMLQSADSYWKSIKTTVGELIVNAMGELKSATVGIDYETMTTNQRIQERSEVLDKITEIKERNAFLDRQGLLTIQDTNEYWTEQGKILRLNVIDKAMGSSEAKSRARWTGIDIFKEPSETKEKKKSEVYSLAKDEEYQAGKAAAAGEEARRKNAMDLIDKYNEIEIEKVERKNKRLEDAEKRHIVIEKRQRAEAAYWAEAFGGAIASGFGRGAEGFKESMKNVLVVAVSFLEKKALVALFGAGFEAFVGDPTAPFRYAAVFAAFEAAKSGIMSFQTSPGEIKRVPGNRNDAYPAIVHGGEIIGRPNITTNNGRNINIYLTGNGDERWAQDTLVPILNRYYSRS